METIDVQPKQLTAIFGYVKALDWTEDDRKEYLRKEFGITSIHDLGHLGAERMKTELCDMSKVYNLEKDKRRKMIIAICYQKSIMLDETKIFDVAKINKWLETYGKHKKTFNLLNLEELRDVSFQLKKFK